MPKPFQALGTNSIMGRLYELFFIAVLVWMLYRRLVHPFLRGIGRVPPMPGGFAQGQPDPRNYAPPQQAQSQTQQPPVSRIDKSNVTDADYRDLD
jgi:hypothetical protein